MNGIKRILQKVSIHCILEECVGTCAMNYLTAENVCFLQTMNIVRFQIEPSVRVSIGWLEIVF